MHEPVLATDGRFRIIVEEAGMMEIHAAVRRHTAVLRLERDVAAGMDVDALVVDRITEQQGRQRDFAYGKVPPVTRTWATKRYGIH